MTGCTCSAEGISDWRRPNDYLTSRISSFALNPLQPFVNIYCMEVPPESSNQSPTAKPKRPRPNRQRYNQNSSANAPIDPSASSSSNPNGEGVRRHRRPPRESHPGRHRGQGPNDSAGHPMNSGSGTTDVPSAPGEPSIGPKNRERGPRRQNIPKEAGNSTSDLVPKANNRRGGRRGAKFNAGLTDPSAETTSSTPKDTRQQYKVHNTAPKGDDLTSTLTYALSTPPYPDCPICFAAIHPAQPTWSCSLSHINRFADDDNRENESSQCCWTTFHLKCIRSWANKSVKELVDAWRARGEERPGEWRCPGCQSKRETVPNGYW